MDFAAMMREERENMKAEAARKSNKQQSILTSMPPIDLRLHEVGDFGRAPCCWYIADWLTQAEEKKLMEAIYKRDGAWSTLTQRRLQNWGGIPHPSGMIAERLPDFLDELSTRLVQCGVLTDKQRPNHCLLNEYTAGQGIDHHNDGSMYDEIVVILSLEGTAVLEFNKKKQLSAVTRDDDIEAVTSDEARTTAIAVQSRMETQSVLLRPRSLLVFSKAAYTDYTHGIACAPADVIVGGSAFPTRIDDESEPIVTHSGASRRNAAAIEGVEAVALAEARRAGVIGAAICANCVNITAAGVAVVETADTQQQQQQQQQEHEEEHQQLTAGGSGNSEAHGVDELAEQINRITGKIPVPPITMFDGGNAGSGVNGGAGAGGGAGDVGAGSESAARQPHVTVVPRAARRVSLTLRRVLRVVGDGGADFTPSGRDEARRRSEWFMRSISEKQNSSASFTS
jgi:alkylated DNA repair protein alkB family protein 6